MNGEEYPREIGLEIFTWPEYKTEIGLETLSFPESSMVLDTTSEGRYVRLYREQFFKPREKEKASDWLTRLGIPLSKEMSIFGIMIVAVIVYVSFLLLSGVKR